MNGENSDDENSVDDVPDDGGVEELFFGFDSIASYVAYTTDVSIVIRAKCSQRMTTKCYNALQLRWPTLLRPLSSSVYIELDDFL